ncbi:MAG TPA: recombinase family protein [Mycobacterium sp.]|jgi:putative resolvase
MPVPFRRLASGTILVDVAPADAEQRMVVYARVSSHDQRSDLDRQVWRATTFVDSHRSGMIVYEEKNSYGFDASEVHT